MADFTLIPVPMHVVHPSDLQIGPPVLVDVKDELEDVLRWSADHGSTLSANDDGLAQVLMLRSSPGSPGEQAKVTWPKWGARWNAGPNALGIEGGGRKQVSRQRIRRQGGVDNFLMEDAHLRGRNERDRHQPLGGPGYGIAKGDGKPHQYGTFPDHLAHQPDGVIEGQFGRSSRRGRLSSQSSIDEPRCDDIDKVANSQRTDATRSHAHKHRERAERSRQVVEHVVAATKDHPGLQYRPLEVGGADDFLRGPFGFVVRRAAIRPSS
jgi:hypothetical protein